MQSKKSIISASIISLTKKFILSEILFKLSFILDDIFIVLFPFGIIFLLSLI